MQNKINKFFLLFTFLFSGLLLIGCSGETSKNQPQEPKEIRITYVKAPLNIPSILEKSSTSFEKAFPNSKVSFPEIMSGAKQTEAMAAGDLDIASALGGTSAILGAANGIDLKIIGIYSRAPKAFTIMVKDPYIQSVKDLKGKKIGGPKGTILHQILIAALAKENMTVDDVEFINMDISKALVAMQSGNLDAALAAGPGVYHASQDGARILITGEGLTKAIIVIAVSSSFVKQYPQAIVQFMKTHKSILDQIQTNPEQAYQATAKETGLSPKAVEEMALWYDFNPIVTPEDIQDLKETQKFMIDNGMLQKEKAIDIEKLFWKNPTK